MATWMGREAWRDYRQHQGGPGATVVGDLRILPDLWSLELGVRRDILVHLPPRAIDSGRRYPVLYMHDGQNLFDAATSFVGEWEVDETLALLAAEGIELIVVGIPHGGDDRRFLEYTPYRGRGGAFPVGGLGTAYVRWVADTVKPLVDGAFPTLPERGSTGIMGSSLGGLISLWAGLEHPAAFGLVGAMSPAFPGGQGAVIRRVERVVMGGRPAALPDRVYVDVGGREGSHALSPTVARRWSAGFLRDARRLRAAFDAAGVHEPDRLRYVEDRDAIHHETAWARRLPDALRFLFGPGADRGRTSTRSRASMG